MEGSDSSFIRVLVPPVQVVQAPAQQARRALSALQIIQRLRGAPPQQLPQTSSGQPRIVPMAPLAQRWCVNGDSMVPIALLPVSQVPIGGMVVSTFMMTTVRRQQRQLYHNATVLPRAAPVPVRVPASAPAPAAPTAQMLTVQNTMQPTMKPVTIHENINHDTTCFTRATPASSELYGMVSPVTVHGNGNPFACIYCGQVFTISLLEILGLLPPPGFNYPEPIRPPPSPLLSQKGDTFITAAKCSDSHHFVLTMQHMPKQAMTDLIWSSQIPSVHILSPAKGNQHVRMASSTAGVTGTTTPMLNPMLMPTIQREQCVLPLTLSITSASPVGTTGATMPSMFNLMPMQAIHKEQRAPTLTASSSSFSGLLYDYVLPEHEDMVHLTLGQSCTMDLDLGL